MAVLQFERAGSGRERELTYFPHASELGDLIKASSATRVLLVATGEILEVPAPDVRLATIPTPVAANRQPSLAGRAFHEPAS